MEEFLERLKGKVTVGLVGGSDLVKILEQLGGDHALPRYDYGVLRERPGHSQERQAHLSRG